MKTLLHFLHERARDIAALLLGLMFLTFIAQIMFRYVLNLPLDWTLELCLTLWLWIVFWGTAFLLEDEDHIRFDIVYHSMGERGRRFLSLISSVALVVAFSASLPATISYVTFYKIKPSMTMGWRLDLVFSCYLIFAVAVILQYMLRCWRIVTGRSFEAASFYAADPSAAVAQAMPKDAATLGEKTP